MQLLLIFYHKRQTRQISPELDLIQPPEHLDIKNLKSSEIKILCKILQNLLFKSKGN